MLTSLCRARFYRLGAWNLEARVAMVTMPVLRTISTACFRYWLRELQLFVYFVHDCTNVLPYTPKDRTCMATLTVLPTKSAKVSIEQASHS